jgi:hypothetical protein
MAAGFAMMPPLSHKNNPLNLQIARHETPISCGGGNYSSAAIATKYKTF